MSHISKTAWILSGWVYDHGRLHSSTLLHTFLHFEIWLCSSFQRNMEMRGRDFWTKNGNFVVKLLKVRFYRWYTQQQSKARSSNHSSHARLSKVDGLRRKDKAQEFIITSESTDRYPLARLNYNLSKPPTLSYARLPDRSEIPAVLESKEPRHVACSPATETMNAFFMPEKATLHNRKEPKGRNREVR